MNFEVFNESTILCKNLDFCDNVPLRFPDYDDEHEGDDDEDDDNVDYDDEDFQLLLTKRSSTGMTSYICAPLRKLKGAMSPKSRKVEYTSWTLETYIFLKLVMPKDNVVFLL